MFEPENIMGAIHRMRSRYNFFLKKINDFPHLANSTVRNWIWLFDELNNSRRELISKRPSSYVYELMNKMLIR
jgi:hypothetical protein